MKIKTRLAVLVVLGFVMGSAAAQSFGGRNASGILKVFVAAVDSESGRSELTEGKASVSRHHGGRFVRVTTIESGMGRATATMNGAQLRELSTVNVCDRGGGYWVACRNGQVVEGRLRVWDAAGKGNGSFTVRVSANNWPYNTLSQTFSIW